MHYPTWAWGNTYKCRSRFPVRQNGGLNGAPQQIRELKSCKQNETTNKRTIVFSFFYHFISVNFFLFLSF